MKTTRRTNGKKRGVEEGNSQIDVEKDI